MPDSKIKKITETVNLLVPNSQDRVFMSSKSINIFPCSRRGQYANNTPKYYDPEARLNTERTNRLHTAINGFKDKFIISYNVDHKNPDNNTLVFVLAGYYIEAKNFNPSNIESLLAPPSEPSDVIIYAHLSIHPGISLDVENCFTEILYRQSTRSTGKQSLDLSYTSDNIDISGTKITDTFFVGVSFTNKEITDENALYNVEMLSHNLPLFKRNGENWELIQTSLLPKVDHDVANDSVIIGETHVRKNLQVDANITIGTPDIADAEDVLSNGVLAAEQILVPYTAGVETDFPHTRIEGTGVYTDYVKTHLLSTDGLAVGDSIAIKETVASSDITRVLLDKDGVRTDGKFIVADKNATYVQADNTGLEVPNTFKASSTAKKVVISAENGLEVDKNTLIKGELTVGNDLTTPIVSVTNEDVVINKDTTINADVAAKNLTIDTTGQVNTPTLAVNTITSDSDDGIKVSPNVTLDKALFVTGATTLNNTLEVTDKVTAKNGLEVSNSDVKVTKGQLTVNKAITVETGDITVKTGGIKATTGTATINDLIVNNNAKIKDLDVDTNIDTSTAKVTNTLNVQSGMADAPAEANIDKATVGNLTVTEKADIAYINVGDPTNPTDANGDIVAQNNITAEGDITANVQVSAPEVKVNIIKSDSTNGLTIEPTTTLNNNLTVKGETSLKKLTATEISAKKITQNGNAIPAISIDKISEEDVTPGVWQLKIILDASN